MQPLRRKEKPDFERFLKVIQRKGGRDYVPFFELCVDTCHFEPVSGLKAPDGLDFVPTSPTFEASFAYYLRCCAAMGFDHGTINMAGFTGYPARRHGVAGTARGFVTAGDSLIANDEEFERYPWPSAGAIDVDAMERTARLAPEGLGIMTGGEAVFQTLELIMGMDNLALMLYDNPALVRRVADRIGSINVAAYDLAASLPFIRGLVICGDMGFKTGTTVSPRALRELILPWHKKMVDAVHRHGKIAILHSCGNLEAIMPDLIACGWDAKHSFEDTMVPDMFDLHRAYGRRICLIGGLDVDFLCRADERALRARVRKTIDTMAPGGGYVLGSGNSIPEYVPSEKWWIMLDEGLKYGRG